MSAPFAPITDLAGAEAFLDSCIRAGIKLGLENTRRLLAAVGDPHRGQRYVHVAGTNGKGSVCSMLATALSAAGYRTGLNTSPHMVHLFERFRVDGQAMDADTFVSLCAEMAARAGHLFDDATNAQTPTFFEVTTVLGFMYFCRVGCDISVIEVGMGGRLDSTNVIDPLLTVITPIDFDHMNALGDTIYAIAGEKAGIIKPGVPLVTSAHRPDAVRRITEVATERGAPMSLLGRDFHALDCTLDQDAHGVLQHNHVSYRDQERRFACRLVGEHQLENAAVVHAVLCQLGAGPLPELDIDRALAGLPRLVWPGRLQTMPDGVVVDGSHNDAGITATLRILDRLAPGRRYEVLFGSLAAKPWRDMLRAIAPYAARIHIAPITIPRRAADPAEQHAWLQRELPELAGDYYPQAADGLARIRAAEHGLVIGSLYLAGEILGHYTHGEPCPITL